MKDKFKNNRIDVTTLNECVRNSACELVDFSEKNYYNQLANVAQEILDNEKVSIILLAGPSASTKTTTSYKLKNELSKKDIHSVVVSLDDFYVNRDALPILPDGSIDYETIETLDLKKLNECFGELIKNNQSEFPLFDFATGMRLDETKTITVDEKSVLIIEGLHALNPSIVNGYSKENFMKLYISPNSNYYMGDEIVLSARDIRLVRRIIRDHFHRSSPITKTLDMWVNVIIAEVNSIMPFEEQADFIIDSTIIYEPNIYVNFLLNLIEQEQVEGLYKSQIERLEQSMNKFARLNIEYVPNDTVIKEFLE